MQHSQTVPASLRLCTSVAGIFSSILIFYHWVSIDYRGFQGRLGPAFGLYLTCGFGGEAEYTRAPWGVAQVSTGGSVKGFRARGFMGLPGPDFGAQAGRQPLPFARLHAQAFLGRRHFAVATRRDFR
jgi:hypothetical protein